MPTISELGQRVKARHPGVYDDLPDDEVGRRVQAKYPGKYDDFADSGQVAMSPLAAPRAATEAAPEDPFTATLGRVAVESLPSTVGFLGESIGTLGGYPGRIGGATAGGSLGEGVREILQGGPLSPRDIAQAGAEQGAYSVAGGALAKAGSKFAGGLMRGALRIGKPIEGEVKIGSELFPDPVPTLLADKVKASPKGAVKIRGLRKEAGEDIGGLIESESGRELSTRGALKHAKEMLLDESIPKAERAKIFNDLVTFYREKGAKMDPDLMQRVKRRYGGIYKGWNKGRDPLTEPIRGEMAGRISQGAQEELEQIPGMRQLNKRYQTLKGAQKAVERSVNRPEPDWEIQKPGTLPLLRGVLGNRGLNSGAAIALAGPKWQTLFRQSPRLAMELWNELTYRAEPDATYQ